MTVLAVAMFAGYSHPKVVLPHGELAFEVPFPPTQPEPTKPLEWLYVRIQGDDSTATWVRQESLDTDPKPMHSSTLDAARQDMPSALRTLLAGSWRNAPCDDLILEIDPAEKSSLALHTIEAVSQFRSCARKLAIRLRTLQPKDAMAPFPSAARAPAGRLPPEKIQEIVRASYDKFRQCYERGLVSNPDLTGRVIVRFVIDRKGRVSDVKVDESDLPDKEAVECMLQHYRELTFPSPRGGIVTVVYPIRFAPN
jgi:TonB family protein